MNILGFLIVIFIFMISEIAVVRLRRKWAKQCNYDCSKCKVWDCQRHICLEDIKKGSDKK